jgi:hypothetical protein
MEIDTKNVASNKSADVDSSAVLSKAMPWPCEHLDLRLLRDFKLLVQ